jgi:hypothetical protein
MEAHDHNWVVIILCHRRAGGSLCVLLPGLLTQTTLPDQSAVPPSPALPPLPGQSAYEPQVQELLETTYLGCGEEFPDPGLPLFTLLRDKREENSAEADAC